MTRILKIKKGIEIKKDINTKSFEKDLKLTIENEYGSEYQGTFYLKDIDEIEIQQGLIKQENKEYYVYNPAENKPKKIYTNFEEALRDAKHIASKYSSCKIHVLEIVSTVTRTSETREVTMTHGVITDERTFENEEIPF